MKKIYFLITIFISLHSFSQGTSAKVDTAAQRKEQEEANKFVTDLITKTSLKDFREWLIENNVGIKDYEVFNKLYTYFIQNKYATKPKK